MHSEFEKLLEADGVEFEEVTEIPPKERRMGGKKIAWLEAFLADGKDKIALGSNMTEKERLLIYQSLRSALKSKTAQAKGLDKQINVENRKVKEAVYIYNIAKMKAEKE